ncbi:MAG: hypothetical protein PHV30_06155 [Candidatus Margulisbacteria bacterium]|nr:hypothetical protein [Candidatus Margulisiibacteriota bacterium]
MNNLDKFSQDIQRIQSEQIGQRVEVQSDRKIAESKFREEFKQKLGLSDENNIVHFSNHAIARLQKRNIEISKDDLQRITSAIDKASEKGSRDSLVLVDDLALVVSIANRTVVTAMDKSSMKEQVITNIDSAIIS